MHEKDIVWWDKKRLFFGAPWTFTTYILTKNRLFVRTGIFIREEKEVRLYRIVNVSIRHSIIDSLFGLGTIHIDSSDKDLESFDIKNVLNSEEVKELISEMVEKERKRNGVLTRDFM